MTAHVATWPLGLVGSRASRTGPAYRLEHLPPVQRGLLVSNIEAAGTPILRVHGIVSNRSIFTLLRRGLLRRRWAGGLSGASHGISPSPKRLARWSSRVRSSKGWCWRLR